MLGVTFDDLGEVVFFTLHRIQNVGLHEHVFELSTEGHSGVASRSGSLEAVGSLTKLHEAEYHVAKNDYKHNSKLISKQIS